MKNIKLLTFVPALVWAFGCAPAASSSGVKKQMASMTAKEVQAKIDSRDFFIDIKWEDIGGPVTNTRAKEDLRTGFLHIAGDTLTAYTRQEGAWDIDRMKNSAGFVSSIKYKIADYTQSVGRKGRTDIRFTIDTGDGIRAGAAPYPVKRDFPEIKNWRRLTYDIGIDASGKAHIFVVSNNDSVLGPPVSDQYIGSVRL